MDLLRRMRDRLDSFVQGEQEEEAGTYSFEAAYRFRFGRLLLVPVGPFFVGYAVHFFFKGYPISAALMLFGALSVGAALLLAASRNGRRIWGRFYYVFVIIGFFLPLFLHDVELIWVHGRLEYLGWLTMYPLLGFFLLGGKKGLVLTAAVFVITAILFVFERPESGLTIDMTNLKVQSGLSLLVVIVVSAVYERTRKLTQDNLLLSDANLRAANVETQRLAMVAEIANKTKSEFLANMSHELRTPLNHIIGFTDLVLEESVGALNESQKEYLQDVTFSSRHLLALINDVLDLSKVEAGKLELTLADIDLGDILERSVVMLREKANKHGVEITVDVGAAPERVRADERKVRQVIYNLLSNALKFTPDGGRVFIRAWAQDQTGYGAVLHIAVSDSGIGIEHGNLERIFLPFEQVRAAADKDQEGTGLGLSLSRRLMELHGGRIWAESEGPGKGSTFHIVLPLS